MTLCSTPEVRGAEPDLSLFRRDNLVAWCIVPFDDRERTPVERSEMLNRLGLTRLAYDYRAQHLPTFDAELDALQAHGIELAAWWFPGELNDEAKLILDVLRRHNVRTQLWVTGGGEPTRTADEQAARVAAEVARLKPIALAAKAQGCQLGLYNHGGWFGEPDNQIAIIQALGLDNVGIVYNQHHGHAHVDDFAALLERMRPYLLMLNLNGMEPRGDEVGKKILPLGAGSLDRALLETVARSGYTGRIGILNHTQENAEQRLQDNLDGLDWLLAQLRGEAAGPAPKYRTWREAGATSAVSTPAATGLANKPGVVLPGQADWRQAPLAVDCEAILHSAANYNILVASDEKSSGEHWELFSMVGSGHATLYLPGYTPDHVHSNRVITDGQRHRVSLRLARDQATLLVDDEVASQQPIQRNDRPALPGGLGIGRLVEGGLGCDGEVLAVRIAKEEGASELLNWMAEQTTTSPTSADAESTPATSGVVPYDAALVSELVQQARQFGDAELGVIAFTAAKSACASCHRLGEVGGNIGPELTQSLAKLTDEQIVEAVWWPKRTVAAAYVAQAVLMDDGRQFQGYVLPGSHETELLLRIPATGEVVTLSRDEIEEQQEIGTLMPEGLIATLAPEQRLDLVAFLFAARTPTAPLREQFESLAKQPHQHTPAEFAFTKEPLSPAHWPARNEPVNRDRVYDFYAKEAEHFRQSVNRPHLIPPFPGLDGGKYGHWGNQDEQSWADARWNETKLGSMQATIFQAEQGLIARGVCVRIDAPTPLAVCYDEDTLAYVAVWRPLPDRYLEFSPVRHGFVSPAQALGERVAARGTESASAVLGPLDKPGKYLGLYRHGEQVIFACEINGVEYLDQPLVDAQGNFQRLLAPRAQHPANTLLSGGPAQSTWTFSAPGRLGTEQPFAVDTIPLPTDNPWKSLLFCSAHALRPDGAAYVATMQGDVWLVTGLDEQLSQVTWRRFASGLHHPLGMVSGDDGLFVLCRDQLLRLHDADNNGEADRYECFSRAFQTSSAGHDFLCGLDRDAQGRFYFASGNEGLVRIAADGGSCEILARGFRNPDGLGVLPDGTVTVPCSEGEWTPTSMICLVRPGATSAAAPPSFGYGGPRNGQAPELPLLYLPRGFDNSAGGQASLVHSAWQHLINPSLPAFVHLSFGAGTAGLVLQDDVRGIRQGALLPLQTQFRSGAQRAVFGPRDGHLYVTGMAGWGSYTPDDRCFQRVRLTASQDRPSPAGFHVHENGIRIDFSAPIDSEVAADPGSHFVQCWNYRYSQGYGSPELSLMHPDTPGHDVLKIRRAHVFNDGRSLFLELPELQPANQLHLWLGLGGEDHAELFATVHALDVPFTAFPGYRPRIKTIAVHPQLRDLMRLTRPVPPNPWRTPVAGARELIVTTGKNLSYLEKSLTAKAGESIALTLRNPDVVPHNWALVQPAQLRSVGEASNKLIADPEAYLRQYVPSLPSVVAYTNVVPPGEETTIYFTAPAQPGRYPYLCTFPGHWMAMNGELTVE